MKKRMKRGSMTIEAALLMPLLLLVVTITLYLFFYVHNKVWLTAASYEAALDGSLEARRAHNPEVIGSNPIPATRCVSIVPS